MWWLYVIFVIVAIFLTTKLRPEWYEDNDWLIPRPICTILAILFFPITLPIYLFWQLLEFTYNLITKKKQ